MVSKELFIGIGLVVGLSVGLGIGFGVSGTSEKDSQVLDMQSFQQMMLDDSSAMQEMILSTMQDSDQMEMMEDMMKEMMQRMQDDPELKQAMMEHMDRMKASKEAMMGTADDQMMDNMMADSTMAFNTDVQITIPMIDGYYNGEKVYFIHTEISDQKMANMMTMMVNYPTLHVPDLENIPEEDLGKFYVFTNGVAGTGPYGGGPFFFQIDIFDTVPNSDGYSEFRVPQLVTWNDDPTPRILTSVSDLLDAKTNGELSIKSAGFVVHLPMIIWDSGTKQQAEFIEKPFITMPKFDAKVINIDEDNYTVTLEFYPTGSMNLMN